jgi:hypothetical protein
MKNNLKFLCEFLGPDDLNNLNKLLVSKGVDWPYLLHYNNNRYKKNLTIHLFFYYICFAYMKLKLV